jgi:GAF domain-containing protein
VRCGGTIGATLWVCSHDPDRNFDRGDADVLERLARHVGTAIDRMRVGPSET